MQSSSKNSEIHNSNQKLVLHMWEDSGQSFLNVKSRQSVVVQYKVSLKTVLREKTEINVTDVGWRKIFVKFRDKKKQNMEIY